MALHKIDLDLRLELLTPVHIGTGYGLAGYLDARMITDAQGFPCVPGSSIKGRLRYYLEQLLPAFGGGSGDPDTAHNLFGGEIRGESVAGALYFTDLQLGEQWRNLFKRAGEGAAAGLLQQRRTNVMLSRLRGVAMERRLFTVEVSPPLYTFHGRIQGYVPDCGRTLAVTAIEGSQKVICPRDLALLVAACRSLTHLGGRKSRGLGRCALAIEADGLRLNDIPLDCDHLLEALL